MKSIFTEKSVKPDAADLQKALDKSFEYWQTIAAFVKASYPAAEAEWHFSGEKYGWSFRIKDKKRVIIYLLPRDKFFKVAFVFGQKATDQVLAAEIAEEIKNELRTAKVYAEGRGIRLDVRDGRELNDIRELVRIKLSN